MTRFPALPALAFAVCLAAQASAAPLPRPTWGDQGDGTFRNPILNADYSDPDVIRVGDDFYLAASDFHFVGMQVLHSRDLVNWTVVAQVFQRLPMHAKYDEMKAYAEGTWAPSLRYHDGTYYLYVCTPHDGLFLWRAKDPAGPWSEMVTVRAVDRWEDPCPFWDDDGQAYLVHGRVGAGPLILHKLSPDGTQLLDEGTEIYRGPVAEGPKLFKRGGWYYISLPEGGVDKGGQTVLRAKSIYGPYERREVLPNGSPHQGGIVELPNGDSWFIGFKSTGFLGRVCHLLPVRWDEDGWPVFGDQGQPMEQARKPELPASPETRPATNDDFSGPALGLQWQWNHNPVPDAWSLTERPGWLRLKGQPAAELKFARNTLTQKLWDQHGTVEAKLDASRLSVGQRAGIAFMSGDTFGYVGVERDPEGLRVISSAGPATRLQGPLLWVRGSHDGDAARFAFSFDGKTYEDTPATFTLKFAKWKGARAALFCFGEGGGHVDVDDFRYEYRSR